MEIVEGILERITFYSDKTSYLVGCLRQEGEEEVTFVGYFQLCRKGDPLPERRMESSSPFVNSLGERVEGSYAGNRQRAGAFLLRMIKGVGPHLASLLVKRFGIET